MRGVWLLRVRVHLCFPGLEKDIFAERQNLRHVSSAIEWSCEQDFNLDTLFYWTQ